MPGWGGGGGGGCKARRLRSLARPAGRPACLRLPPLSRRGGPTKCGWQLSAGAGAGAGRAHVLYAAPAAGTEGYPLRLLLQLRLGAPPSPNPQIVFGSSKHLGAETLGVNDRLRLAQIQGSCSAHQEPCSDHARPAAPPCSPCLSPLSPRRSENKDLRWTVM